MLTLSDYFTFYRYRRVGCIGYIKVDCGPRADWQRKVSAQKHSTGTKIICHGIKACISGHHRCLGNVIDPEKASREHKYYTFVLFSSGRKYQITKRNLESLYAQGSSRQITVRKELLLEGTPVPASRLTLISPSYPRGKSSSHCHLQTNYPAIRHHCQELALVNLLTLTTVLGRYEPFSLVIKERYASTRTAGLVETSC